MKRYNRPTVDQILLKSEEMFAVGSTCNCSGECTDTDWNKAVKQYYEKLLHGNVHRF